MAYLQHPALFFTTSPRTPSKMIPEIRLLCEEFGNRRWDRSTQEAFMECLARTDFFDGSGSASDPAWSARDRINRSPKALGFVNLEPCIALTEAGRELVYGKRPQEVFLRQLLKFQLPSPYHQERGAAVGKFRVRPYLEILRLVRDLQFLTFDEFRIFAVRLTDYREYESIKTDVLQFREKKAKYRGNVKKLIREIQENAVRTIYQEEIARGHTRTRETADTSLNHFFDTKKSNFRDYADAAFRYLHYTGLVSLSHKDRSIAVLSQRKEEVNFILETVPQEPVFISDETAYKAYLFDASIPALYSDNREKLTDSILRSGFCTFQELSGKSLEELKDLRDEITQKNREAAVSIQVEALHSRSLYTEIMNTYQQILSRKCLDLPLMLEYNTWRAMTMLDGGMIQGNFKRDDTGEPLSTAPGNRPDIECDYGSFVLSVEVTLQTGQRQYESEGEPVARLFGNLRKQSGRDTYCLFIAKTVNPATLAHFYGLNHTSIAYYGGKSRLIPLELNQFMALIEHSRRRGPAVPSNIIEFLDRTMKQCEQAEDETDWKARIQVCVDTWLND